MIAEFAPADAYNCTSCPLAARWPGIRVAERLALYESTQAPGGALAELATRRLLASLPEREADEVLEDFAVIERAVKSFIVSRESSKHRSDAARRRLIGNVPKQHSRYEWQR